MPRFNFKFISTTLLLLISYISNAQQATSADFLRSTGKIYGIVACIVIIFIVLAIFLFRLDRKLTKLEKQIENEH